ncbi:cysteine desulfuration protein SufE [Caulobacter segnis]|jgi:cysteine desulfuration protein SufE|uniref:Fe-S metabolism associated SufE n=2 Tax=Caulobacter segnis TaxID=88688 RepID=D5VMB2_CAUST|nr:SufE family protein [Caulobacter segnis]ADG11635.1 Fe-S metabolism associated SufE [Caulobacter segnis ATCC 21756]AVQ03284.1 cysteine desulfuration protein SufE [Caulobacter segnis]
MTNPINAALDELADEFELLGDWEERYRYVIELGKDLAPLTDAERSEENKVRGCASQVWLVTEPQADGTLAFRGDSDAHIVSGLVAIMLRLYSGRAPADIVAFDAKAALDRLGLSEALSSQRSNGLKSMVGRIQRDAQEALGNLG